MAILPDYLHALNREEPAVGSGSSSIGTSVFVMHTDATNADAAWNDPYNIVYGAGGTNSTVRPIVVPSMGLHLELNVCWTGSLPSTDQPVVAIYGEVPSKSQGLDRYWPVDIDPSLSGAIASGADVTDSFWVPLVDWDNQEVQAANHELVDHHNLIGLLPDRVVAMNSGGMFMGIPRRAYLSGCTRVICTIETAADNATAAVIIGRFVG